MGPPGDQVVELQQFKRYLRMLQLRIIGQRSQNLPVCKFIVAGTTRRETFGSQG
ncbi:hypothetical protein PF008_g7551 [Phytophthora fragariae]|uniref:Uncharacterized protein n=1 Tax=Phytophthora fragariae TaxID=53985 RepID=A0A6G0S2A6_9STRA|nr:hypothetical protein PF008_g7551 [Phytophthora fragariae]